MQKRTFRLSSEQKEKLVARIFKSENFKEMIKQNSHKPNFTLRTFLPTTVVCKTNLKTQKMQFEVLLTVNRPPNPTIEVSVYHPSCF
ncbi:hypothetical protein ABK040_013811 [Willaertia magna]